MDKSLSLEIKMCGVESGTISIYDFFLFSIVFFSFVVFCCFWGFYS